MRLEVVVATGGGSDSRMRLEVVVATVGGLNGCEVGVSGVETVSCLSR